MKRGEGSRISTEPYDSSSMLMSFRWHCEGMMVSGLCRMTDRRRNERNNKRKRRARRSRYVVVTDALRHQLADGALAPGMKLPALRTLAEQFNVSVTTVRIAIRILEAEGCLYHVRELGAFVQPARRMPSAVSMSVALVTIDMSSSFEVEIARGIEQACQERGWSLQIMDAQAETQRESHNLRRLAESGTDGAIILPTGDPANAEVLVQLKLSGYPIVLLDRGIPGLRMDLVQSDHEQSAHLATKHLIQQGVACPYLLMEPFPTSARAETLAGFERAVLESAHEPTRRMLLSIDPAIEFSGLREGRRWRGAYEAVKSAVGSGTLTSGIVAPRDHSAWGAYEACRELGLSVPGDVSIVALEDSELARAMMPPLTAVAQRPREIGGRAVELMQDRLEKPEERLEPRHVRIGQELIERASVRIGNGWRPEIRS